MVSESSQCVKVSQVNKTHGFWTCSQLESVFQSLNIFSVIFYVRYDRGNGEFSAVGSYPPRPTPGTRTLNPNHTSELTEQTYVHISNGYLPSELVKLRFH